MFNRRAQTGVGVFLVAALGQEEITLAAMGGSPRK